MSRTRHSKSGFKPIRNHAYKRLRYALNDFEIDYIQINKDARIIL